MRVEDFWLDMYSVYVVFLTNDNREIKKTLYFYEGQVNRDEISEVIMRTFKNVNRVVSIDEWDQGLVLK